MVENKVDIIRLTFDREKYSRTKLDYRQVKLIACPRKFALRMVYRR